MVFRDMETLSKTRCPPDARLQMKKLLTHESMACRRVSKNVVRLQEFGWDAHLARK